MTDEQLPPTRLSREEVKEKLRAFLQSGASEDVASVLVHSLMQRAEPVPSKDKPK